MCFTAFISEIERVVACVGFIRSTKRIRRLTAIIIIIRSSERVSLGCRPIIAVISYMITGMIGMVLPEGVLGLSMQSRR